MPPFFPLISACQDEPVEPKVYHTSCGDAPGVDHSGADPNSPWKAADGPHQ